ncbi:MAG: CoA-binding protein [Alphaproteobacteria bacterium]
MSAPVDFDHHSDYYADAYIRDILRDAKVFACVGASANWNRPSYFASKYLIQKGYRVIPVNPRAAGQDILGETAVASLSDIDVPVDVVQLFRRPDQVEGVVDEALSLTPQPKVVWMQLAVVNHAAADKAEAAGLKVVMNRCPKIEYARLSGELGWNGFNTRVITAKKRAI